MLETMEPTAKELTSAAGLHANLRSFGGALTGVTNLKSAFLCEQLILRGPKDEPDRVL